MTVSKKVRWTAVFALGAAFAAVAAPSSDAAWRERETARLAGKTDRDSLIAATLLGLASAAPPAAAREQLAQRYGNDPLAALALAWACQRDAACDRARYDALVRAAPDEAIGHLLLPAGAAPDAAQLHAAASARYADSRLGALLGIVRDALPAADDAARAQRRSAIDAVPLPTFGAVVSLCKAPAAALRGDCLAVGKHLVADRGGAVLARMVGVAIVRRLASGTPDDTAAQALRRDYTWMGEVLRDASPAEREALQDDVVRHGEWEAMQRAAERKTGSRTPPAGWAPSDPNLLKLPEERTAPPSP